MYKTLWSLFWGCILVQIIWWSAGHNEAFTFDLIERERAWQIQYLGFDLVERVNQLLVGVEQFLSTSPIPSGNQASLEYSEHYTDHEVEGAVSRILAIPYLQATYAIIILAIGRILATGLLGLNLLPFIAVVIVDALCVRKIRYAQFLPSSSFLLRTALVTACIMVQGVIVMSFMPFFINPYWILFGFICLSVCIYLMVSHAYK